MFHTRLTDSPLLGLYTDLEAGTYSIVATDEYNCKSSANVVLTDPKVLDPQIFGAAIVPEKITNRYQLTNVDNVEIDQIVWYLINEGVLCSGDVCEDYVDVALTADDTLCVEITDVNNCVALNCIALTYLENVDISIPNVFSPDGDGQNDIFYVTADNSVELIKEMKIFDRWGENVFSIENANVNDIGDGWDGEYKGKKLSPGVYVYYIVFKLKERDDMKVVGDITIVR
ncbi:MAG: gliding motility-associated C-terminal domain-containing protein [Saprospiraceae bacterium]